MAAHSKHIARVVAKKHLEGLREQALGHLHSEMLMEPKLETSLNEKVLPWLYDKVEMFMQHENEVNQNTSEMVETGMRTL